MEEVGDELPFDFDECGVEGGVVLWFVDIEVEGHLAVDAPGFVDSAEVEAVVYVHLGFRVLGLAAPESAAAEQPLGVWCWRVFGGWEGS